ncbi:hypothetical protein GCM10009133_27450 [Cocleimonas flava]|uniref:Uncharacterized protein n=1 Tax=Cocleimonas flava TaxID=634765 RepID=A0A4R1ES05_9GAMM|nr:MULTISPECIES: hypothetical protein [Cocleimonas]MEB8432854.1 hypothetical protein [Cocleimonas sp. KMM 6892]MEC4715713.1 hypothetical protein [Cocleimonas sp. KMM 6895]MEC4744669.1 hypothetical protein [Cocleimonas sp. KMM 6896]TCJ83280.1 hypothetical protein EV695_4020 [Cocleimonas flava]
MLKTFMIEKIEEEVCSDSTGKMTFHLVDENGDCRRVCGMTFLDENGQAQGISSESKRELPLIESLFSDRHKKIVDIEFDHFNKVYNRELDKTVNEIAYEKVLQMEKEKKLSYRIKRFFKITHEEDIPEDAVPLNAAQKPAEQQKNASPNSSE